MRANKERCAAAEAQARARHPSRPSMFDLLPAMGFDGFGGETDGVVEIPFEDGEEE